MATVDEVEYKGITFRRYSESDNPADRKYYRPHSGHIEDGVEALHREIWRDHNGEIPEGHHIHHKDGDPSNNDIENLECVSPKEHARRHPEIGGVQSEEHFKKMLKAAKGWHKSDEGSEWHRQHAKEIWEDREPKTKECEQCGTEFEYFNNARFCSNACKAKWRRESGKDDEVRECIICGSEFTANKYNDTKTCSRECAGISQSWTKRLQS